MGSGHYSCNAHVISFLQSCPVVSLRIRAFAWKSIYLKVVQHKTTFCFFKHLVFIIFSHSARIILVLQHSGFLGLCSCSDMVLRYLWCYLTKLDVSWRSICEPIKFPNLPGQPDHPFHLEHPDSHKSFVVQWIWFVLLVCPVFEFWPILHFLVAICHVAGCSEWAMLNERSNSAASLWQASCFTHIWRHETLQVCSSLNLLSDNILSTNCLHSQFIPCKRDYLDFLSGRATPYWLYQHVPAGVGLTIPLECQVGRALGVMHAHLGEKALTSERAMQPNNRPTLNIQSTRLYLAPVLAILSPAVCPTSSKKVNLPELLNK